MGRDVIAMRLELTGEVARPSELASEWTVRLLVAGDVEEVGALSYVAYRGSVDDQDETPEQQLAEISGTFAGKYGMVNAGASFGAFRAGELVASTIVTTWRGRPLLAFALTLPAWQGQGLATHLILRTAQALVAQGQSELTLAVTKGNPALRLYLKLGFAEFTP
jgi:GNAT superfamily N-acetyltransferase